LPSTPTLRREEIRFKIGLLNALMHTQGYAAPDTTAFLDHVRSLIEQAQALGDADVVVLLLPGIPRMTPEQA
jgi:hypothetical protein